MRSSTATVTGLFAATMAVSSHAAIIFDTDPANDVIAGADTVVLSPAGVPVTAIASGVGVLVPVPGLGDYDWFKVSIPDDTMLSVTVSPFDSPPPHMMVTIFDATGAVVLDQGVASSPFLPALAETAFLPADTYLIAVNGVTGPTPGIAPDGTKFDHAEVGKYYVTVAAMEIPEPASLALLGLGGLAVAGRRRKA